jgi:putative ABC transport system ATP-binding protein
VLELQNLVKHYRLGPADPIRAVDDVSAAFGDGQFVALYGPSGSGKTTLLDLIGGLLQPDSGCVIVDGHNVTAMSRRERDAYRLHELGIVGQPENLIAGATALENAVVRLLLKNTPGRKQKAERLLAELGLAERMHHRTHQLSLGERQRIGIARALSTDPKLILADEPTGTLDSDSTNQILGLLRSHCKERGVTALLATHDPQAAAYADDVRSLRDGRLTTYSPDSALAASRLTRDH